MQTLETSGKSKMIRFVGSTSCKYHVHWNSFNTPFIRFNNIISSENHTNLFLLQSSVDTNPPPTTILDTLKPDLSEYQPGPPAQITPPPIYQFQPSSYYPTEHPPHVQFPEQVYIYTAKLPMHAQRLFAPSGVGIVNSIIMSGNCYHHIIRGWSWIIMHSFIAQA